MERTVSKSIASEFRDDALMTGVALHLLTAAMSQ
jgi:hypothetical protein